MAAGAKIGMKVMSIVIGVPVGIVTRNIIERTWTAARPTEPPRKASDAGVQWADALGWAALSAVGIVAADMLTRRGTEVAFTAITGTPPPPSKPGKKAGKGSKKLEKAAEKSPATNEGSD